MEETDPKFNRVIDYINSSLLNKTGIVGKFISHDEVIDNFEHDLIIPSESPEVKPVGKTISNQEIIEKTKLRFQITPLRLREVILFELDMTTGDENIVYKRHHNGKEFWVLPQFHDEFLVWSSNQTNR